jgi:hypothetical protein
VKTISIAALKRVEAERKPGYVDYCLKAGKLVAHGVEFTDEQHAEIRVKFAIEPEERKRMGLADVPAKIEYSLPSLLEMAKNAAAAARRVIVSAAAGQPVCREDSEIERIGGICKNCEFLRPDGRCAKCGCGINKWLTKLQFATEHCPLDPPKW